MFECGITKGQLCKLIEKSNADDKQEIFNRLNTIKTHIEFTKTINGDTNTSTTFATLPDYAFLYSKDGDWGAEALRDLYKIRAIGKMRYMQNAIDLKLRKENNYVETLCASIQEFFDNLKDNKNQKTYLENCKKATKKATKKIKEKKEKKEKAMIGGFSFLLLVALVAAGMTIISAVIKDLEDLTLAAGCLTSICGIIDFGLGVGFFWYERASDKEMDEKTGAIEDLTKNYYEIAGRLENATERNEQLADRNKQLTDRQEQLTDRQEQLTDRQEREIESLRICKQCHVPLENYCNVCGHKCYPEESGTIDGDYTSPGITKRKKEQESKSYNWTLKECIGGFTVIFNNKHIVLKTESIKLQESSNKIKGRLADLSCVKKILFNTHVKTVKLTEDSDLTGYQSIRDIFPNVEIVAFAQPDPDKDAGDIYRQYELGKNIFKNLYGTVKVRGLEYIAKRGEDCFDGWGNDYLRTAGLSV